MHLVRIRNAGVAFGDPRELKAPERRGSAEMEASNSIKAPPILSSSLSKPSNSFTLFFFSRLWFLLRSRILVLFFSLFLYLSLSPPPRFLPNCSLYFLHLPTSSLAKAPMDSQFKKENLLRATENLIISVIFNTLLEISRPKLISRKNFCFILQCKIFGCESLGGKPLKNLLRKKKNLFSLFISLKLIVAMTFIFIFFASDIVKSYPRPFLDVKNDKWWRLTSGETDWHFRKRKQT